MKNIEQFDCFFFDFFDTVMFRDCRAIDIKKIWSKYIPKKLFSNITAKELFDVRIACEQYVSSKNTNGEFTYFELIQQIYNRLKNYYNIKINETDFYNVCLSAEIDIEKKHQFVNSKLVNQIKKIKKENKKIYIVSDFYLDANVMRLFLNDKNIVDLFDDIFVSCDFGENKATLGLYKCVKEKLKAQHPSKILMTGDNFKSDFINAKLSGIKANYLSNNCSFGKTINLNKGFRVLKKDDYLYADYSFYFYLFNVKLYNRIIKDKIEKVYFLSREGEFLKELFDDYCESLHKNYDLPIIETKYLYVSRQSTYAPSLSNSIENETFEKLFDEYPNMSISSFCKNIGIQELDILNLRNKLSIDFDFEIIDIKNSKEFKQLKSNESFIDLYRKTITDRKKSFINYIRTNGIHKNDKIAIVDVGWKGSIQDNIFNACENLKLYGYYCGLKNNVNTSENNKKYGLMFTQVPYKSDDYDVWSFDSNFMERLLTASHASTNSYKKDGEKCSPVFSSFESEKQNYKLIKPVQKAIRNKHKKIISIVDELPCFDDEIYRFAKQKYLNMFKQLKKDNMVLQAKLLSGQMENFGYQKSAGEQLKTSTTVSKIAYKLKHNIKLLKDDLLIAHILFIKGFYRLAVIYYRKAIRKVERKQK